MMTLEEFIEKYHKTKVDFDGFYGAQCVDLFRQYCADVWGIPRTEPVSGARELYTNYKKTVIEQKYLEQVKAKSKAQPGDAIVFDGSTYGHVAIVIHPDKNYAIVLEQDGFKQDGVKIVKRPYTNLLGFLRLRENVK